MRLSEEGLRERGILRSVEEMVAEAQEMVALSVAEMPLLGRMRGEPAREFTEKEVEALERGGLDLSRASGGEALARTASRHAALLASALTEPEAAAVLGVSQSRVRQRIGEGTLYFVRAGRERRLPRYQFSEASEGGLVPNIGEVLRAIPEDAHPLAVEGWFVAPDPDLVLGDDEEPLSPRQWLLSGGPAPALKPLAAEL